MQATNAPLGASFAQTIYKEVLLQEKFRLLCTLWLLCYRRFGCIHRKHPQRCLPFVCMRSYLLFHSPLFSHRVPQSPRNSTSNSSATPNCASTRLCASMMSVATSAAL